MEGNITPSIPPHIVEEILTRADTRTLFQCAFVCRDWNMLITSPDFISRSMNQTFDSKNKILFLKVCHCKKSLLLDWLTHAMEGVHFQYCPSPATYSLHWDNDQLDLFRTMESPPIHDFKGTEVIDASNGLVCLATNLPFKLILWNPTIRKYAWLPFPMTWDEMKSNVGFGFDRNSNDIKVVNLVYTNMVDTRFDSAWVFSYVTWSWKQLTCSIPPSWFINSITPYAFLNGVFYWIATHIGDGYNDNDGYQFILTFDLTHEVFGQILFPNDARLVGLSSLLTTGDSLLLIQQPYEGDRSNFLSIWIMKQFGNHDSWINIFSTTTKIDNDSILGAMKNGDFMLNMGRGEIRRYNPTTLTYLVERAMEDCVFFRYHTESLYLLEKESVVNSY